MILVLVSKTQHDATHGVTRPKEKHLVEDKITRVDFILEYQTVRKDNPLRSTPNIDRRRSLQIVTFLGEFDGTNPGTLTVCGYQET